MGRWLIIGRGLHPGARRPLGHWLGVEWTFDIGLGGAMSRRLVVKRRRREVCPGAICTTILSNFACNVLSRVIAGVHERYCARWREQRIINLRVAFSTRCRCGSLACAIVQKG